MLTHTSFIEIVKISFFKIIDWKYFLKNNLYSNTNETSLQVM